MVVIFALKLCPKLNQQRVYFMHIIVSGCLLIISDLLIIDC
jgi:hypothetical protein